MNEFVGIALVSLLFILVGGSASQWVMSLVRKNAEQKRKRLKEERALLSEEMDDYCFKRLYERALKDPKSVPTFQAFKKVMDTDYDGSKRSVRALNSQAKLAVSLWNHPEFNPDWKIIARPGFSEERLYSLLRNRIERKNAL